jgi:predicted peptidase
VIPRRFLAALLLLAGCSLTCTQQSKFLERQITLGRHVYRYRVWLPPRYTKLRRWPVILFLHGSGESGNDDVRQLTTALPAQLVQDPSRYHAVVVIPQCPTDREWYGEMETQALAALDASIKEFRGDPRRLYLTGVSMGGAGAWYFARHPGRWAAIVPVCGEVVRQPGDQFPIDPPADIKQILHAANPYDTLARAIGSTPVWIFHGSDDPVISPEQARRMFAALRAHHGNVQYTEYPGVGHNSWDRAYAEPGLPKWLLAQRLSAGR